MQTFFTILDWTLVILTLIGLIIPILFFAAVVHQQRAFTKVVKAIFAASQEKSISFSTMWGSVTLLLAVLYFAERFGMPMTLKLTMVATIVYMVLGTILSIINLAIQIKSALRR